MATNTPPRGKRYHQIAADLQKLIDDGVVGPGDRLPTEAQLCARYGVTRPTVKRAYEKLVAAGEVISAGLAGYFVRGIEARRWVLAREHRAVDPWTELISEAAEVPRDEVTIEVVTAQRQVQHRTLESWFDLVPGGPDEFTVRNTLRTLGNRPVMLSSAFVPSGLVEGTPFRRPEPMSSKNTIMFFEDVLSRRLACCQDSMATRMATDREARLLELPDNSAVMEIVRRMHFFESEGRKALAVERLVVDAAGAQVITEVVLTEP